ncbi:M48 family metallopeptidase [Paracoccus sp. S-4012]|uniref:M48 family metallopeptidase n=1 Tax=Paracoccus sp. S-4012 TaxID=2665648 RepID=UPI001E644FFF|nr:M48 family metallopeptidase [Paracoccus sp. S-4012]
MLAGTTLLALGACAAVPVEAPSPGPVTTAPIPAAAADFPRDARGTARAFVEVIARMEPSVEEQCMRRRRGPISCDYQFVVVDDPRAEINAFQDLDSRGRPVIGFTLALIAATRNADELAFVIGHEASHHILDHLTQKSASARTGAVIFGALATATGADPVTVRSASQAGADFGARYYSKDWELQADYLGAIVTLDAGYNPERGAQFFLRIPDPGNRILGTHPSRQQRIDAVARAVADKRAGRVD